LRYAVALTLSVAVQIEENGREAVSDHWVTRG
jgi:hypothetical protein